MKTKLSLLLIISLLGYLSHAFTSAAGRMTRTASEIDLISGEIPDSIHQMIETSCMQCHSDDGSAMARGKLNFSKWNTYSVEKKFEKASECCIEMSKGDMPPKKWRTKNPTLIPTQAKIDAFCIWSKSLPVK
jgi:hypothetical protein